jgi:hypothetical protein
MSVHDHVITWLEAIDPLAQFQEVDPALSATVVCIVCRDGRTCQLTTCASCNPGGDHFCAQPGGISEQRALASGP